MAKASKINRVPDTLDLALYAGDGVSIRMGVTNSTGDPVDLGPGEMKVQIRKQRGDAQPEAEFDTDWNTETSTITLTLTGEQTAALISGGESFKGVWDIQWSPTEGLPVTLIQGEVTCVADVTR